MAAKPDQQAQADENHERTAWGIAPDAWDAAFAWADDLPPEAEPVDGLDDDPTPSDEPFRVWRCNWAAVVCFMGCSTQWHRDAMGRVDGLRYPGVEVVMRHSKIKDRAAMFDKLQLMEAAALEVLRG